MKKYLSLLAIGALVSACDDPKTARRALDNAGFTRIETLGWSFFGCGQDDDFATRFRAVNYNGKVVEGVVCSGWFKGATIRHD